MGLFDLGNQLLKVGLRTSILPINIMKDIVTMGGVLTDEKPSTLNALEKLTKDIEDIPDKI